MNQLASLAVTMTMLATVSLTPQGIQTGEPPVKQSGVAGDTTQSSLFNSHDFLVLTIEAPLTTIFKDRGQESEEHPGTVSYDNADGNAVTLPVDIRTRGKTRLQPKICRFPPLRLDFPSDEVGGTLFAGQDKMKLVTHCQDSRSEYEQYVLQEYLIYRTYNLLTEMSFQVRPAHITYVDTDGERDTLTRYAFLIEDEDAMAARSNWGVLHTPLIPPHEMDPMQLALLEVFQYMIGNTDWSAFMREPGREECCHNTKPIGDPAGPVFSVPYDFDITGVVATRYANRLFRENLERANLRTVRQRLYRGACASGMYLDQIFHAFNEQRESIYALYREQEALEPEIMEKSLEYYDDFYEIINDSGKIRREFTRKCREI
jgi:hypothetical protein